MNHWVQRCDRDWGDIEYEIWNRDGWVLTVKDTETNSDGEGGHWNPKDVADKLCVFLDGIIPAQ